MEALGLWFLGQAVIPDAYSRFLSLVRDRSSLERLTRTVHDDTGVRPGRRYKRWLRQETTWRHLVAHRSDDYEQLIDDLARAEAQGFFRQRAINRERAAKLVNATIVYFLPSLEPSMATAVADARADQRHAELMARLDAGTSYTERLTMLPPPARRVLEEEGVPHGTAERLVDALLRSEPRSIVASLAEVPPTWLDNAPATIYLALAEIASAYGAHTEAGQFFEHVADLGLDRSRYYAKAAYMYVLGGQPHRRPALIEKARATGAAPLVDVVEGALDSAWDRVLAAVDRQTAADDPLVAGIYAGALNDRYGRDAAITFLSELVEREPQWAGIALMLAQLLLQRSTEAGTTSRARDLESAQRLALQARDLRRQWRGDSREAAVVACHAALIAENPTEAIRIGTPEPDGTAWPEEAAEPEVQFYVAQAALSLGDHETAQRAAASVSGFRQELIKADILASSDAPQAEIADQYHKAWELAQTENEQVDFWLSASMAGLEPLPGADQLEARTDDLPLITTSLQHLARRRYQEAINILRPHRQNERARSLLVRAYVGLGGIDQAVAEIKDMADRFDNPTHLVNAVQILVRAERLDEAAELADRALTLIGAARAERAFLHEVGVASANNRGDWPDMEARSRAWINDCGPNDQRVWALAISLYQQGDLETAWRVLQERGDPEPQTADQAQLWIMLHVQYQPSSRTLSKALALCDKFPDDPGVRARAVNAFFLMGDEKGDIDAAELSRWHTLIQSRAEQPAPGDTFHKIDVPDDFEALTETLRPLLEPRAIQIEEWKDKVRNEGWPYGLLAEAAGGYYTSALVHRAAGFLPIASADPHVLSREREAALSALNSDVIADLSVLTTAGT
jgi:tetratricopeptide (TPR) repeat protein